MLIGKLAMPEPRAPGVRHLGFVPESDKMAALAGARLVICPSPYESLSIITLEAWTPRGPAMDIRVRPEHCRHWAEQAGFVRLEPGFADLPPHHYGLALRPVGRAGPPGR